MSELKISGQFIAATKYQQLAEKFGIQKFYLDNTTNAKYPSVAEFQVINKKIDLGDIKKDETIIVYFNITGRKVKRKSDGKEVFVQNLTAWKVEKVESSPEGGDDLFPDGDDDLPF